MTTTCKDEELPVHGRKWYYFILTSLTLFFGGLFLILCARLLRRLFQKKPIKNGRVSSSSSSKSRKSASATRSDPEDGENGLYVKIKEGAGSLISAKTLKGQVLVVVSFLLSMSYIGLYYAESAYPMEHCLILGKQRLWVFEIALNLFFVVHFIIRFLAANDKLLFWLEMSSIVDFFTVPQVFVSIVIGQNWLGLRFLRALQLLKLSEVLQIIGILHTAGSIDMTSILGNFFGLWVTSAGMVHLLENSGDPFENFENKQILHPFDCLYFLLVTMSTVGYGDIYCHTYLGKIFVMIFICVGLAMFTSYIPIILAFAASKSKYNSTFKTTEGRDHVVVCGHITKETVESFLREFLHPDRNDVNEHVVFLYPAFPSSELKALLQRNQVNVSYFKGTVLDGGDCERVKMREASAILILANRHCGDPDAEDSANIMRVISIKNFSSKLRVVIQLLQYHNKMHLFNIRSWNADEGDDMVCVSELKLGFIAQSCISQGFSTLLANIFAMRSQVRLMRSTTFELAVDLHPKVVELPDSVRLMRSSTFELGLSVYPTQHLTPLLHKFASRTISQDGGQEPSEDEQMAPWKANYLLGASKEMYTETISTAFAGITFNEFAQLCFEKLGVTPLAIQLRTKDGHYYYVLNPCDEEAKVEPNTKGCFIADSAIEVQRVLLYCHTCHIDIAIPEDIKECACQVKGSCKKAITPAIVNVDENETCIELFTPSGVSNGKPMLKNAIQQVQDFSMQGGKASMFDSTGTYYWCEKVSFEQATVDRTRAEQIVFSNHIVVCVFANSDGPLLSLRTLCIPLRASNLHPAEIKKIVFVGDEGHLRREWEQLCNFPDVNVIPGSPFNRADLNAVNANLAAMVVVLSPIVGGLHTGQNQALADKESIMASLNLKAMPFDDVATVLQRELVSSFKGEDNLQNVQPNRKLSISKLEEISSVLPMITELVFDGNVQYLDDEDEDEDGIGFYETQPFACGHAFTVSVLDSLMTATYFNSDVLNLVRALVTGGVNAELEALFAEGREVTGMPETPEIAAFRKRAKLAQMPLSEGPLQQFGESTFGELFTHALKEYQMVCIGIYRSIAINCAKRYVMTAPAADFALDKNDMVFVLAQSNFVTT